MLPEQVNRSLRVIVLSVLAAVLSAGHVAGGGPLRPAGGLIISTTSQDTVTGKRRAQRTILSGRMVRTEEGGRSSILSPDLGRIWESSARGQGCLQYSAADLARRRQAAEEDRRRTFESTAASTPDPEAQLLLRSLASSSPTRSAAVSYRKLVSGEVVGRWTCDRFAKEINGVRTLEVCVVPISTLKVSRTDLVGLTEADRVFGAAPSTWDQETLSLLQNAATVGYDAFPVRIEVLDGSGRARFVSELGSLTVRKIPSRAFEAPAHCTPAALTQAP